MKYYSLLIFLLFPFISGLTQVDSSHHTSPFELNWGMDAPILIGGATLNLGSLILIRKTEALSETDLSQLSAEDINSFDRKAIEQYSKKAKTASDIFMLGSVALPAILLVKKNSRKDWLTIGVMGLEVYLTTAGLTNLTKPLVLRPRPFVYNESVSIDLKEEKDARYSFFSGHSSLSAAGSFFTASLIHAYSNNKVLRSSAWTMAISIPAITGLLRYKAGKHFPTDIVTGYLIGASTGLLIPFLHRRKRKHIGLTLSPFSTGSYSGLYISYMIK